MSAPANEPIARVIEQHREMLERLPFHDVADFDDAQRGFLGKLSPCVITAEDGRVVWDNDSYDFLDGEAPPSVNPSLWRVSRLNAIQGLFEVVPGFYQVRGLDIANITFVEGETGVIVIDPLVSSECAAAALALYREHRGERPVTAVIYTHSHVDHYGGVKGVVSQEDVDAGRCVVVAPEGFGDHLVSEWVYAGGAMARRAAYMYAAALERGPFGQVGAGLGQTNSTGTITLINPTLEITRTGQEEVLDGVRVVFQLAPGTEAPAEMHFYFPDHRALCTAENATHTLHNLLTLRGAEVRDARAWAGFLGEMLDLFGHDAEVVFSPHHWPTWGNDRIVEFLTLQRELYSYLHDQTLRLLNQGFTGPEIAEMMTLPPALENAWHARGYYGSVSHNVKAVYQRYLGWYDGNPAHLWQHPPQEQASRYVEFMGGADAVVEKARASYEEGDLRWVAEVASHVVFAHPDHQGGRDLLADALEQLGYGAENGVWRSIFLMGTRELRIGNVGTPVSGASPDTLAQMTPEQIFDGMAFQVDGPRAWDDDLVLDVEVTDVGSSHRLRLHNGVLTHGAVGAGRAPLRVRVSKPGLAGLATGAGPDDVGAELDGDTALLARLQDLLQPADPDFAIVTP